MDNIRLLQENPTYKNKIFVHINTILNHDMMLELTGICDVVYHMAAAVGVQTDSGKAPGVHCHQHSGNRKSP